MSIVTVDGRFKAFANRCNQTRFERRRFPSNEFNVSIEILHLTNNHTIVAAAIEARWTGAESGLPCLYGRAPAIGARPPRRTLDVSRADVRRDFPFHEILLPASQRITAIPLFRRHDISYITLWQNCELCSLTANIFFPVDKWPWL